MKIPSLILTVLFFAHGAFAGSRYVKIDGEAKDLIVALADAKVNVAFQSAMKRGDTVTDLSAETDTSSRDITNVTYKIKVENCKDLDGDHPRCLGGVEFSILSSSYYMGGEHTTYTTRLVKLK